jgi:uncharacterized cofD-like protein
MGRTKGLLNVVSIGGGTGLACLLKGLKNHVDSRRNRDKLEHVLWINRLTAVVTVTDDGGSSGRLRDELRVLPPGDIRNCMVALSADESLMSLLFQYRFEGTGGLGGHSFGNLFLTAMTGVTDGDFLRAIRFSSEVLAIQGHIYPSTLEDVHLEAITDTGAHVRGESMITRSNGRISGVQLQPPNCRPIPAALAAIRNADIVTVGPGSLYTSLVPNLLVPGVVEAIRKSRGMKVYVGNLMTQPGETTGFRASDHLEVLHKHAGGNLFDIILLNRHPISPRLRVRYSREGSVPVENDIEDIRSRGLSIFRGDFLASGRVVRHDPELLAAGIRDAYIRWKAITARHRKLAERDGAHVELKTRKVEVAP